MMTKMIMTRSVSCRRHVVGWIERWGSIALIGMIGWLGGPVERALAGGVRVGETSIATLHGIDSVDFERQVLPILTTRCFECHDARKQTAGLRLDARSRAFAGGESGLASIVPGQPDESELILRVESQEEFERMPPKGPPLTPEEIGVLRLWIEQGATWPDALANDHDPARDHWAFRPPNRPALPDLKGHHRLAGWVRNPIDHFVAARLAAEGLEPSPAADRLTLARRIALDLTGLPPSIEQADALAHDPDPDDQALARYIESHLRSPHYGEHWARWWLDAARYADSDGFEKDKPRSVWNYRDYVINAFNANLPYDRFVIEQLAGDWLPNATPAQKIATGFLRNSMINEEGGVDPEQFRMEAMFDRMDAVGKSLLGLTIQCAQCHDHKYDPLKQSEYYQMFAFLNNDHEASIEVFTPEQESRREDILSRVRAIEAELKASAPDWRERLAAWEATLLDPSQAFSWSVIRPEAEANSTGGQKYLLQEDGSFLCQGYAPTKHTVMLTARVDRPVLTAFRLEALPHPDLPLNGPGRSIKGTFALTEFKAEVTPLGVPNAKPTPVEFVRATATVNPPERELDPIFFDKTDRRRVTGPVEFAIDGRDQTAWSDNLGPGRRNRPVEAVFLAKRPLVDPGGRGFLVTIRLVQNHGGWNSDDNQNHNLGRFRLSVTDETTAQADPVPLDVRASLKIAPEQRTPDDLERIFAHWRTTVPQWHEANQRIDALLAELPEGTPQLVLQARAQPRTTRILKRGDFLKPGDPVQPGTPAFLHPLETTEGTPLNRLTFARWVVDRRSPTTARAIVNRVWQRLFGVGLVETPEDLGVQSPPPSHPELLDWLAVELMESGWDLNHLQRLILTSATYRQSSRLTPQLAERDPNNRLLARMPRLRLEAEVIRDAALAASGLLNRRVGGPSVFPPLPEFLLQPPVSYGPKSWPVSPPEEQRRRSLYIFRYRSLPYPALEVFDAPPGEVACVRRSRSNTPLQALTSLNEPVFVEAARGLALATLKQAAPNETDRLTHAFRRVLTRYPVPEELAILGALRKAEHERLAAQKDPQATAWTLLAGPEAANHPERRPELPNQVDPIEAASWVAVARALLNLDEAIVRE